MIKELGRPFIQGLLAVVGFGALTYGFVAGKIGADTYVPLVSLMVGFFFSAVKKE